MKVIKEIFNERRLSKEKPNDFVDALLDEIDRKESSLNEETALDLAFLLLFASHETMTLAMKYLSEQPAVLAELLVCDQTTYSPALTL
jgi:cytochrome P450